MKTNSQSSSRLRFAARAVVLIGLGICFLFCGCTAKSGYIIAATGTTIGVELSQDTMTQNPNAVLGYKRAELAYVPTNAATAKGSTTTTKTPSNDTKEIVTQTDGTPAYRGGAKDSANVLMELNYTGFSKSGVYQRLAVGDLAVVQDGATMLFAKNNEGEIDASTAKYISLAKDEIKKEQDYIGQIVAYVSDGSGSINPETLKKLLDKAATIAPTKITDTVKKQLSDQKTSDSLSTVLNDPLDPAITPLHEAYLELSKK
jgi:osmotically-inducible protein OsmY